MGIKKTVNNFVELIAHDRIKLANSILISFDRARAHFYKLTKIGKIRNSKIV